MLVPCGSDYDIVEIPETAKTIKRSVSNLLRSTLLKLHGAFIRICDAAHCDLVSRRRSRSGPMFAKCQLEVPARRNGDFGSPRKSASHPSQAGNTHARGGATANSEWQALSSRSRRAFRRYMDKITVLFCLARNFTRRSKNSTHRAFELAEYTVSFQRG